MCFSNLLYFFKNHINRNVTNKPFKIKRNKCVDAKKCADAYVMCRFTCYLYLCIVNIEWTIN